jgi:hypothetical protein
MMIQIMVHHQYFFDRAEFDNYRHNRQTTNVIPFLSLIPLSTAHPAALPVALLAPLEPNLSQGHADEQAQVPGDHVEPKLVINGRTGREMSHVLADGGGEKPEERLSTKGAHTDVGRDEPASGRCHQHGRILLDPVGCIGISANNDGLPRRGGAEGRLRESCRHKERVVSSESTSRVSAAHRGRALPLSTAMDRSRGDVLAHGSTSGIKCLRAPQVPVSREVPNCATSQVTRSHAARTLETGSGDGGGLHLDVILLRYVLCLFESSNRPAMSSRFRR